MTKNKLVTLAALAFTALFVLGIFSRFALVAFFVVLVGFIGLALRMDRARR